MPNDLPCHYGGLVHAKAKCPAYCVTCKACGKRNHFARVCKQAQKHLLNLLEEDNESDDQTTDAMWYISQVNSVEDKAKKNG